MAIQRVESSASDVPANAATIWPLGMPKVAAGALSGDMIVRVEYQDTASASDLAIALERVKTRILQLEG